MSDPFCCLHTHCEFSFQDGYGHPKDFAERAHELGQQAIAITDHGNVSAHYKWVKACKAVGIKPILGVEAYICDNATAKDKRRHHITLWAKTLEGYRNLLKLVSLSWEPEHFYYKPRIDWGMLQQHARGLIGTSGCPGGRIGHGMTREQWDDKAVVTEMQRQSKLFEPGNYFAELSHWNYDGGIKVARSVHAAAVKLGLPMVMTIDAHYPRPEDAHAQDVMLCIQNNALYSDPNRMKFTQQDFCLWSGEDMARKWHSIHNGSLSGVDEMILNSGKIADSIDFAFPTSSLLAFPFDGDKVSHLRQLCEQGMIRRGVSGSNYIDRLNYEFGLTVEKDFVDYFLIVSDLVVWAKNKGILVGPARGSSCGSLMCYLLKITEIDPMRHGLMFERFIDVSRKDPPDIDLDFESERRWEVKDYLSNKYGQDRVASLPTFSTFKGKLCLQDIGRVFADKIPDQAVQETKRLVIQRSSADSRAGFTIEDTFTNFEQAAEHMKKYPELAMAKDLEGHVRQLGVHAAGIVISNEPLSNFAATYVTAKGDRVISMDYSDANDIGLLKIDILGLTALTAAKRILATIESNHGIKINLNAIPLDEKVVYDNFCAGKLEGIFQFEGASTKQVCRQVQPDNFESLTAVNALSRPGPLHSGSTTSFIERRFGRDKTNSLHPMVDDIVGQTHGLTIYQEQVMGIVRKMGKFDWAETASIRKAMSKKLGDEFVSKMRDKFIKGAQEQGVDAEDAAKVWQNIATHGSWSFNRLHSVAYSVMAYNLMWLKAHFPTEFYSGMISCEPDSERQRRLVREYTNGGGKIEPVDINHSLQAISCNGHGILLGFESVVGLPTKAVSVILERRPFKDIIDFDRRCKIPQPQKDKLLKIGAFRNLKCESVSAQTDLFGADKAVRDDFDYRNPKASDILTFCPLAADNKIHQEWRQWLKERTKGRVWKVNELDDIEERTNVLIVGFTNPSVNFNLKNKMEEAASRGIEFKPKDDEKDFTKQQFAFLNFDLDDGTESIIVRVSYRLYPVFSKMLWALKPDQAVAVRGMVNGTMRMVFATDLINASLVKDKIEKTGKVSRQEKNFLVGK